MKFDSTTPVITTRRVYRYRDTQRKNRKKEQVKPVQPPAETSSHSPFEFCHVSSHANTYGCCLFVGSYSRYVYGVAHPGHKDSYCLWLRPSPQSPLVVEPESLENESRDRHTCRNQTSNYKVFASDTYPKVGQPWNPHVEKGRD